MHAYDVYRCGWASFHYVDSPFLTGLEVSDFTLWAISPAQGPLPCNSLSVSISAAFMVGVYIYIYILMFLLEVFVYREPSNLIPFLPLPLLCPLRHLSFLRLL